MNFMATEYGILLPFFWLSFGIFGSLSAPCAKNQVVSAETHEATITTIPCAANRSLSVTFYPAEKTTEEIITTPTTPTTYPYVRQDPSADKTCNYDNTHVAPNSGGVYKCWLNSEPPTFAQFIVVDATPVCDAVENTKATPPCDQKLTCTLKYSATSTYVDVSMAWSYGDPPELLQGVLAKSTDDEGVTTAISTLDKFPNVKPNTDIYCRPTLSLTTLPTGFDKSKLNYDAACQKTSPTQIACPPGTKPGDAADESKGSAGGLSVGLFKRNVIILMVGIAAILLIHSKGTSGV